MSLYSSDTRIGPIGGPTIGKFVPFIVYARLVPVVATGRNREYWHDMEKKAQKIEDLLLTAGFKIAVPVAFTPTFRQAPARATIVGFWPDSTNPVAEPVTPTAKIIHSGTVEGEKTASMTPPKGTQTWGDLPTAQNKAQTLALKVALEAAVSGIDIFYMDVDGVKYGQLPNKKGFFTLPS